ncbi:MAG TPA: hypothetical protein VG899_07745 [Mycobacteriales bacterium]|nr:hypothetical protein [Mycobacteriales bacterium]HWA66246.1 hypothetical protein [Mycobacteriales bacterium]
MRLVLDSGGLIAIERGDRAMWIRLKSALLAQSVPITHAGVLGQVWRGAPRQARLSQALAGIDVRPLDQDLGRLSGELLAATRTSDVVDAALALIAEDGDEILTSDPDDIAILVGAAERHVEIIRV